MTNYTISYPQFSYEDNKQNEAEVRTLALALSIQSVVGFEQPRNDNNYREAHNSREFVNRAKIFEEYLRTGSVEDVTK